MLIDTHCHIFSEYYENREEIINEMKDGILIVSGDNKKDNLEVIELCKKYPNVYGTIGYHPETVDSITGEDLLLLEEQLKNQKIVGIGEIGLDYHYTKENKDKQFKLFIDQISLAKKYNLPIVVHSREAALDTLNILKEHLGNNKCVMHCYSYGIDMAELFLRLGVKFGIGGTLTFKNNKKTVEVVEKLGLENFVLETDSPFLAPVPFRGEVNRPIYIKYVAEKIALIKNINVDYVIDTTMKNAKTLYNI